MPTEYDAGAAKSRWELDLSPLRASVLEAKRLYAELALASQQASQPRGTATVVPRSMAPNAINVGSGPGRTISDPAAQAARAEAALLRQARAEATLATAQGNTAKAADILSAALTKVDRSSIAAIGAETQLARATKQLDGSMAVLPRTIAGLSHEAASFAVNAITMGGAVSAVTAILGSFADAFKFKADLDASRASINVLLQGVRDSGQVFADASAYAARYKLTQEEMTGALNASTMIMRQSSASTEQILNVMQRLTVLNPAENIKGAAFSIKELASGDITSIAERFNVSRAAANKMKAEILAGGDAVKILDQYLQGVGVTSDALAAKLSGPVGKMKDLAIEQEQLKLAQGEFAMGPGMKFLELQINATRGATRLMSGDLNSMSASLQQNAQYLNFQGGVLGFATNAGIQYAQSQQQAATNAQQAAQAAQATVAPLAAQAEATSAVSQATQDALAKQADALGQDREMAGAKAELAGLADQVARGLLSSGDAALIMARDYGIAAGQAAALIAQQAGLAKQPTEARQERTTAADTNAVRDAVDKNRADAEQKIVNSRLEAYNRAQASARAARDQAAAAAAAQGRYTEATESSAARVARLRGELAKLVPGTADYIDQQTKIAQAEKSAASERTKSGTSAEKLATKVAGAANAEAVAQRDAMRRIELMTQDHYDKLRRLEEDYTLSSSRKTEDYQLERQRLLANGQIKEAQLLEQKFALDQKRAAEDNARNRQRETEQAAQGIADAQQQAGLKADDRERKRLISGIALTGDGGAASAAVAGGAARQAQAEAALASTAGQRPSGGLLRIQFAPISLIADGQTLANVVYPDIEARIDEFMAGQIATILVTSPPGGGQGAGVGGPTP